MLCSVTEACVYVTTTCSESLFEIEQLRVTPVDRSFRVLVPTVTPPCHDVSLCVVLCRVMTPPCHTVSLHVVLCCFTATTETAESQYTQAEEHGNKLKQLLLKTKKDLADAKKLVCLFAVTDCNTLLCLYVFLCRVNQ